LRKRSKCKKNSFFLTQNVFYEIRRLGGENDRHRTTPLLILQTTFITIFLGDTFLVQTKIRLQLLQSQEIAYSGAKYNFNSFHLCIYHPQGELWRHSDFGQSRKHSGRRCRVFASELISRYFKTHFFPFAVFFPGGKIALMFSEQTAPKKGGFRPNLIFRQVPH